MARREWNVARNGQFGRLVQSAGVCRNPRKYAGTGAIRQKKSQPIRVGILRIGGVQFTTEQLAIGANEHC